MASSKHAQSYQLKSLCKYAMPPVIFFSLPRKADTNNYIAEIKLLASKTTTAPTGSLRE